jgi:hypothetical protein
MQFWGRASAGNSGFQVSVINIREVQARFAEIEAGFRKAANGEARDGAQSIARQIVIPELKMSAAHAPNARFATRFASTAVAKRDRAVVVKIPGKNPVLSGLQTGIGKAKVGDRKIRTRKRGVFRSATTSNVITGLAWGSEMGPWKSAKVNHYGVPRKTTGYWVQPAIIRARPKVYRAWIEVFNDILVKYGVNR